MDKLRPLLVPLAAGVLLVLSACAGSAVPDAGGSAASGTARGDACVPVPGGRLTLLEDDLGLQRAGNVVPAVTTITATAHPALLPALDAASAALDTDALVALNGAVELRQGDPDAVAAAWVADSDVGAALAQGAGVVVVGAADSTESAVLAHIYAEALAAAGFDARVQPVGNREQYLPALISGNDVQVVPEYLAPVTADLAARVGGSSSVPVAGADVLGTYDALQSLADQVGLTFGDPSPAADQPAFAVTEAFAAAVGVRTLSELASACGDGSLVLGGPAECPTRPTCRPGLEDTYGLQFADFHPMEATGGLSTRVALEQGEISIGLVSSSDAALAP